MSEKYTIVIRPVTSHIVEDITFDLLKKINDVTSYKNPNAWGHQFWNDKVYLFDRNKQSFPTGLLRRVKRVIKFNGDKVVLKDLRPVFEPDEKRIKDVMDNFPVKLRDYQLDCLFEGMQNPHGLFWLPTGSGKTLLFSTLMCCHNLKTLVLTHRKELFHQLKENIEFFTGEEVGQIGSGIFYPRKWTVGIVNTLTKDDSSSSEDNRMKEYLKSVEYLIEDEVHHLGSKTWIKLSRLCVNTKVRHGFSGTCFRTDNSDLLLLANTGDVIAHMKTSELIEQGWLSRPIIYMPVINVHVTSKTWHSVENEGIVENVKRNTICCEFIKDQYEKGKQILVLIKILKHGKIVKDLLIKKFGIDSSDIRYMHGLKDETSRQQALADFKHGKFQILIGSSIYNEGIDLPTIGAAVNMAGGDSDIATTQRLGRAIRKTKKEGESDVDINEEQTILYMDPYDNGHRFLRKHSVNRKKFYLGEPAFRVLGAYDGDNS